MVWDKLTVDEHFELFARAYDLEDDAAARSTDDLLAELDFVKYRAYRIEELSGGTRQKLNLALSLMHDPELLLLDEPYSGFDWETCARVSGERGCSRANAELIGSVSVSTRRSARHRASKHDQKRALERRLDHCEETPLPSRR